MSALPLERPAFGWLRERDIDLLLCAELHARGQLADHLSEVAFGRRLPLASAWVSHAESDGESDLIVTFNDSPLGLAVLLVENKIAAAFQPDQAVRYRLRAVRAADHDGVTECRTVLFAPEAYFLKPESQLFDVGVTYETVAKILDGADDGRSTFFVRALLDGVAAIKSGYVPVPHDLATDVWLTTWQIAHSVAPDLRMAKPSPKPGRSNWIYFRAADGFPARGGRAVLVYKAERGQVDLQFSACDPVYLQAAFRDVLDEDMRVEPASKSASIRIAVPAIDFNKMGLPQSEAIADGLRKSDRLRQFYIKYGQRLP